MHRNRPTRIIGGIVGALVMSVLFLKALADVSGYASFLFNLLPEPFRRFAASGNGILFLMLIGFACLWWSVRHPSEAPDVASLHESNTRLQNTIATQQDSVAALKLELIAIQPRRLSESQQEILRARLGPYSQPGYQIFIDYGKGGD